MIGREDGIESTPLVSRDWTAHGQLRRARRELPRRRVQPCREPKRLRPAHRPTDAGALGRRDREVRVP
jgi:hypothetical protein